MQKILKLIFVLIAISIIFFTFEDELKPLWSQVYAKYFPCQKPIYYSLGSYDDRFALVEEDFLKNIQVAEQIWEKPIGRNLFEYKPNEVSNFLTINLIYDFRQEATDKLKTLGLAVSETRSSYDSLKAKFENLEAEYQQNKKVYEDRAAAFKRRQDNYEKEVSYWNARGGAPKETYNDLQQEGESLRQELAILQRREEALKEEVSNINALVVVINNLARSLNLNVAKLDDIAISRGEEFTQGEYKKELGKEEINIYEFSTNQKLVSVIAHELGHALGLNHLENEEAIMYRLNENTTGSLTEEDLKALTEQCKIK